MTQNSSFAAKRVLVLGLGLSGRAAAQFLLSLGALVYGIDGDEKIFAHQDILALRDEGLKILLEIEFKGIEDFDLLVVSPGVPLSHKIVNAAREANVPFMGEIELGCRYAKNPMLGITGTNGKTTVTLFVAHALSASQLFAKALGNVGVPLTSELMHIDAKAVIALELSSYQIETLSHACLDAAVILNITPDHLDRYQTMELYAAAKCSIERALKQGAQLYMEERSWQCFGHLLKKKHPRLYGYCKTNFIYSDLSAVYRDGKKAFCLPDGLKNKRSHDLENLLASYALCADRGVSEENFLDAWRTFAKPAHRIEFVGEWGAVRYFDDSKGTNVDAVIRAVQSLDGPIILIAGGVDKGSSYIPWLEEFRDKVKLICAIGQAAAKIHAQLGSQIPVAIFKSIEEAVQEAVRLAEKGGNVLLSPGCSSFDMFQDYAHRGNEFQRIVRAHAAS